MPDPLNPQVLPPYVPQLCQVHSCKRYSVAFCMNTYVFVCEQHRQEFCVPDKHELQDIEQGLQFCIADAIGNEKASRQAAAKYALDAIKYQEHLSKIRWDKQAKIRQERSQPKQ